MSDEPEKPQEKPSRADRFRNMVNSASAALDMDGIENLNKSMTSSQTGTPGSNNQSSSGPEEEIKSSDEEEDNLSTTSSVKILPKTREQLQQEEDEFKEEGECFINQTVDKTFEKLTQFMKDSGIVFRNLDDPNGQNDKDETLRKQDDQVKLKRKRQDSGRRNDKGKSNLIQADASSSGTTIYDTAIEQANNMEDQSMNKTPKRISTSSEKIGENEINDDTLENLNNLSLISGHREREDLCRQWETSHRSDDQQDPFYNRPPRLVVQVLMVGTKKIELLRTALNREPEGNWMM